MTNITAKHLQEFKALTSGEYSNFALFSCFLDGEPTAAIVAVTETEDGNFIVTPLFVAVTPGMKLTDPDGQSPQKFDKAA